MAALMCSGSVGQAEQIWARLGSQLAVSGPICAGFCAAFPALPGFSQIIPGSFESPWGYLLRLQEVDHGWQELQKTPVFRGFLHYWGFPPILSNADCTACCTAFTAAKSSPL